MKKTRSFSISLKTAKIFFSILILIALGAIASVIFIPRHENADANMVPPDWMLIGIVIAAIPIITALCFVLLRDQNIISLGKSYAIREKNLLYVGYYICPKCENRFTRAGFCSSCPPENSPNLEFREEVWKES